jgi:5-deoxy-glucuronate isomerase
LYRDRGLVDRFEELFSAPKLAVRRFRMRETESLKGLDAGPNESLVVPLNGRAKIEAGEDSFSLGPIDALYLPPGKKFSLRKLSKKCDIVWASAPAKGKFGPSLRKFKDCEPRDCGTVASASHRLNTTIMPFRKGEVSEMLRAGYTVADPGNWTSFPPHRHDGVPEVYIFAGLKKGFGLQMDWSEKGENVYLVRDGDAVGFNAGYHPNVGDPTTGLRFLWVMSSDLTMQSTIHPDFTHVKE